MYVYGRYLIDPFVNVALFINLGMTVTDETLSQKEIKRRLN
jgi:hypothetical protein